MRIDKKNEKRLIYFLKLKFRVLKNSLLNIA